MKRGRGGIGLKYVNEIEKTCKTIIKKYCFAAYIIRSGRLRAGLAYEVNGCSVWSRLLVQNEV